MSDVRWGDRREYVERAHEDGRPRVYGERDRDDHDPRISGYRRRWSSGSGFSACFFRKVWRSAEKPSIEPS